MKNNVIGFFLILMVFMSAIQCQQTSTTITTSGTNNVITVSWTHRGAYTAFSASSKLTGVSSINNVWFGLGLNSASSMVIN